MKYNKEIIVMVGNIGSGKSTLVKKYANTGYVIVSRDSIRYGIGAGTYTFDLGLEPAVKEAEDATISSFMKLGVNIVIDEVGMSVFMRKNYLSLAKKYGYTAIACILPTLSMKVSVDRRMQDPHGQYNRLLWEVIWKNFDSMYECPSIKEGFKSIVYTEDKGESNG